MKKTIAMILAVLLIAGAFSACGPVKDESSSPPAATGEVASGKISVVGSTSVGPLMEKVAAKFNETNPDIAVDIQQVGSAAGIQAAIDGSADIGMASREVTQDELAKGIDPVAMALDGIAVIVNKDNGIPGLTMDQIQKIYTGEITNWKDVGGQDAPITVIVREEGSGTRGAFEELLKLEKEITKADGTKGKESTVLEKALVQQGNGAVKAGVAGNPNAIGYLSLGMVDDTINALKVDNVDPTVANITDKTYKISRPFNIITKGEPGGLVKTFMDFIFSADGQAEVEADGYIKVK